MTANLSKGMVLAFLFVDVKDMHLCEQPLPKEIAFSINSSRRIAADHWKMALQRTVAIENDAKTGSQRAALPQKPQKCPL